MSGAHVVGAAFAGNFQAAWYLTIICSFGVVITGWAVFQVVRTLRPILREGDVLLFATLLSLVTLVVMFFVAIIAMALVSLGPPAGSGT